MGKAILRGLLCGICAAVYIFIVLVSVYFNLIPEQYARVTELIMPIGCAVIVPVFLEKSRISRFFMSALFFAAAAFPVPERVKKRSADDLVRRVFGGRSGPFDRVYNKCGLLRPHQKNDR